MKIDKLCTALIVGAVFCFSGTVYAGEILSSVKETVTGEAINPADKEITGELLLVEKKDVTGEARPVDCSADYLEYDEVSGFLHGKGNVKVIYGSTEIGADEIRFNIKTSELEANGNITVDEAENHIKGAYVKFNMKDKIGRIEKIEMRNGPWFFKGIAIEKPDEKNASIIDGYATTCKDTVHPHYRMVSQRIHVELDNVVESWNVLLYIGDIPVFWLPYIWKSLKASPKSPLTIRPGYSSSEGAFLKLAYNYDISANLSGALMLDLMTKKGSGYGLQQNYRFDDGLSGGYLYAYYILEKDTLLDRFRIDFDHSSRFGNVLNLYARLNYLSDEALTQDYSSYVYPVVSRNIRSYIAGTYYNPAFSLSASIDRQDNFDPGSGLYKVTSFTLPSLNFSTTSLRLGETTAYFNFSGEMSNYYSGWSGYYVAKLGLHPSLTYSMKLDQFNSLSSSFGFNAYTQDRLDTAISGNLTNADYNISTNLHTSWNMNLDTDFTYSYSQRLTDTSYDTYGGVLNSRLDGRINLRSGSFLSSTFSSGYDFRNIYNDPRLNFSNIVNSTNVFISQYLNAYSGFQYSIASEIIQSFDVFFNFGKPQETRGALGLNYVNGFPYSTVLDVSGSASFNLTDDMRIEYGTRYDTQTGKFREHRLTYSANLTDCWYGDINVSQNDRSYSFGFNIQLRAFKESALDKKISPEVFKY